MRLESILLELNCEYVYGKFFWRENIGIGIIGKGKVESIEGKEVVCIDCGMCVWDSGYCCGFLYEVVMCGIEKNVVFRFIIFMDI